MSFLLFLFWVLVFYSRLHVRFKLITVADTMLAKVTETALAVIMMMILAMQFCDFHLGDLISEVGMCIMLLMFYCPLL